jgi:hypothetical protein
MFETAGPEEMPSETKTKAASIDADVYSPSLHGPSLFDG